MPKPSKRLKDQDVKTTQIKQWLSANLAELNGSLKNRGK
jgi:hypothetical protein